MNQRLQNYDNYKQLWDYYTGTAGMSPVEAAANLANVHAESRANPGALNPQDGSDGSDSRGILQWNAGRASRLDRFAKERGATANDLMLQAQYQVWESMEGPERANYARARQIIEETGDPAQGAMAIAKEYIRPASQHIPQRGDYGKMFYDMFAGGNPNGVQPGLQYSPQQGEALSREREQVMNDPNRLRFDLPGDGQDANAILKELARLSRPSPAPQIDMTPPGLERMQGAMNSEGPRQDMASPQMPTPMTPPEVQRTRPTLPGSGDERGPGAGLPYTMPTRPEGPPARPMPIEALPEGDSQFDQVARSVSADTALDMGIDPEDAPKTVAEAKAAVATSPQEGDSDEEAERKERRRLHAAQMLETLSVGLGQMSTRGGAVSLGGTLQNQRAEWERRDIRTREEEEQQRLQAQQAQQAQVLAQNLAGMGETGLARMAMSGPDGFATAAQAYQTLSTRKPSEVDAFLQMSPQARETALRQAGATADQARVGAQMPDIGAQMMETLIMPDPAAERQAQEDRMRINQAEGIYNSAAPYMSDPAVRQNIDSMLRNPTQANIDDAKKALIEAGGEVAEMAEPLSDLEAQIARNSGVPEEMIELAKQDPNAAEQVRSARGEGLVKQAEAAGEGMADQQMREREAQALVDTGVLTPTEGKVAAAAGVDVAFQARDEALEKREFDRQQEGVARMKAGLAQVYDDPAAKDLISSITDLDSAKEVGLQLREQFGTPDKIKSLQILSDNPELQALEIKMRTAEAGGSLSPAKERALNNEIDGISEGAEAIRKQRPVAMAMKDIWDLAANGAPSENGPWSGTVLTRMQSFATDLLGDEAEGLFLDTDRNVANRILEGYRGRYFGSASADIAGALSDMDVTLILQGFPATTDSNIKRAILAQSMVRDYEARQAYNQAELRWAIKNEDNPEKLFDADAKNAWLEEQMAARGKDALPKINTSSPELIDTISQWEANGNLTDNTVIYVENADPSKRFVFYRDFKQSIMEME
jgi:hypothetical protein